MSSAPEDLAFARYRRTRRPEALAAVFDATATRLLLVALHLARDTASAEDLVQATFVAAIGNAHQYHESRPVLPWLLGILSKQAALAHRDERRRPDPARLAQRAVPADPARVAETREFAAEVARALDGIPRPYRQVLVLRLLHALEPAQIAHALERSPQTVRSQLHRGLEMLRRALPKGLALPAVTAVTAVCAGRGLAAVRASVLAGATARASGALGAATPPALAVASAFSGGIIVQKLVLALVAVVGAAVLAFTLWPRDGAARAAIVADTHTGPPLHGANRPSTREAPPPAAERVAVTADTAPDGTPGVAAPLEGQEGASITRAEPIGADEGSFVTCWSSPVMADVVLTLRFADLRVRCRRPLPDEVCAALSQVQAAYEAPLRELMRLRTERAHRLSRARVAADRVDYYVAPDLLPLFLTKAHAAGRNVRAFPGDAPVATKGDWPLLQVLSMIDERTGIRASALVRIHRGEDHELDAIIAKRDDLWLQKAARYVALLQDVAVVTQVPSPDGR